MIDGNQASNDGNFPAGAVDASMPILLVDWPRLTRYHRREKEINMHKMKREDIPRFVEQVAATGCNITGIAGVGYVIGDADLPDDQLEEVIPKLSEITDAFGDRDHLLEEITEYLVSIGRSYPVIL